MFTVGATAAGAAAQIDVDPTIVANPSLLAAASTAAGLPGDNRNMLALIATERTALSTGVDAASSLAEHRLAVWRRLPARAGDVRPGRRPCSTT